MATTFSENQISLIFKHTHSGVYGFSAMEKAHSNSIPEKNNFRSVRCGNAQREELLVGSTKAFDQDNTNDSKKIVWRSAVTHIKLMTRTLETSCPQ